MARRTIVQTSRWQRAVVALLMAGVFALALGLAYLNTGPANAGRAIDGIAGLDGPTAKRVVINGLALDVPADWSEVSDAAQRFGGTGAVAMGDPRRRGRLLWLTAVSAETAVDPRAVADWALRRVLRPAQVQSAEVRAMPPSSTDAGRLTIIRYMGKSDSAEGEGFALHLMASLSADGRRYWLVYLTDRIDPGDDVGRRTEQNLRLLQQVIGSATLEGNTQQP